MTAELAAKKQRLRKEIEEVKTRIKDHQQLANQLELSLLELRAKPRPFGKLTLPTQEAIKLSSAEKFRLRNVAEISKQELGKFIGIRVSDYKHEPQSFVVELTVTNKQGVHLSPYYAAFKKQPDGSYKVLKNQLPHMIIMSETKRNFPLENPEQLGKFVRELHVCCQSYVDRKEQIEDFMAVRDVEMIPTVSVDDGYLFLHLGVMLDKEGGKLSIHYHHNRMLPHKFNLTLKDTNTHRKWSESLQLLYKCNLVEALGLLAVKESPADTEHETDSHESVTKATKKNSQPSREVTSSKSTLTQVVKSSKKSKTFNFIDSSSDEANRTERMKKKRAKIASNIRRKTYWGTLSQKAAQEADDKNSGSSVVDSDASKEQTSRKIKPTDKGKKSSATEKVAKAAKATKSQKSVGRKQTKEVGSKVNKLVTPPAATDSELSGEESVPKASTSPKISILAPIFRKSAGKGSVRKTNSGGLAPLRSRIEDKQPLLAAVFHKARKSLLDMDSDSSKSTADGEEDNHPEASEKPAKSPRSLTKQSQKDNSLKSHEEAAIGSQQSPPKNFQSSQNTQTSSDMSTVIHEEQNSDTVVSETKSATPRKLSRLVPNSQESSNHTSIASVETLVREDKNKHRFRTTAQIALPRIDEKELLELSPHKQKDSELSVSWVQGLSQESTVRYSASKKSGAPKLDSEVGSKSTLSGRKRRIQDEDQVRRSPRKKDVEQDAESGVGSKKGGQKTASVISHGGRKRRIQDEDQVRRSPRKKDVEQDAESGVGSKKGGQKTASDILHGGRKRRIQDEDQVRRSPRKKDVEQDAESGVGSKKDGQKTPSDISHGGRKRRIQDEDQVRRSPRKKDVESGVGVKVKKGGKKTVPKAGSAKKKGGV